MAEEEKLIIELRAIVISCKGGITLQQLQRDFIELDCSPSLYKNLGFHTLEDFVRAHPEEFFFRGHLLFATLKEESQHIQRLVNQQQSSKRRGTPRILAPTQPFRRPIKLNNYGSRFRGGYVKNINNNDYFRTAPQYSTKSFNNYTRTQQSKPIFNENSRVTPQTRPVIHTAGKEDASRNVQYQNGDNSSKIVIKRTWPQELFRDGDSQQKSLPPRLQAQATKLNNNNDPAQADFSAQLLKSKPKEPLTRQPFRHNLVSNEGEEKDIFFEEYEEPDDLDTTPSPLISSQGAKPSNKSPPHPSLMSLPVPLMMLPFPPSVPLKNLPFDPSKTNPSLSSANSHIPGVPPSTRTKNPVAARFAKFKAQTQLQETKPGPAVVLSIQERLSELCKNLGLPNPEYQMLPTYDGSQKFYICYIRVGSNTFKSDTYTTDESVAKNLTASKVFNMLSSTSTAKGSNSPIKDDSSPESSDETSLFLQRLQEMLLKRPNGIWLTKLEGIYEETYNAKLPAEWNKIVRNSSIIRVEAILEQELITLAPPSKEISSRVSGDKFSFELPTNVPQFDNLQTQFSKPPLSHANEVPKLSPKLHVRPNSMSRLTQLEVPDSPFWDVHITNVKKPLDIAVRIIGADYSDKLDDMITSLEMEMLDGGTSVTKPEIGDVYAVQDSDTYFRGHVNKILPDDLIDVYNIDDGENQLVKLDQLFYLKDCYFNLPPQAVKLTLKGLEDFPDLSRLATVMDTQLVRRTCVCEVLQIVSNQVMEIRVSAILWDTSTDLDINVNLWLMQDVVNSLLTPTLTKGIQREMVVSHVDENIYVQNGDNAVECIAYLIEYLVGEADLTGCVVDQIELDKIYLVKNVKNGLYQRAKVLRFSSLENLEVGFIDYGNSSASSMKQLLDTEKICPFLKNAAPQAVKISLVGGPLNIHKQIKVKSLLSVGTMVMVKVMEEAPFAAQIYMRSHSDRSFRSISQMIQDLELGKDFEPEEPLSTPPLPPANEAFQITVTLAASPSVFKVRCMKYYDEVDMMMNGLQMAGLNTAPLPTLSSLKVDEYYACLKSDIWYRAKMVNIIGDDLFNMEFCDFGNIYVVSLEMLRILPSEFRKLPRQSLRATLADIVPVSGDWTPADCVFFQDLVMNKVLAAYLQDVKEDDDGLLLKIHVIDTSDNDVDVNISQQLVDCGIAYYHLLD